MSLTDPNSSTSQETSDPTDPVVVMETTQGTVVIELYPQDAPKTVANFIKLVKSRFYEGDARRFHRYVADFVIQGGDPLGNGRGGPGYTVPAEIKRKHVKGTVATARLADEVNPKRESSGSQFYICLADTPFLDGGYTAFGQVIQGMDVVMALRQGDEMKRLTLHSKASL